MPISLPTPPACASSPSTETSLLKRLASANFHEQNMLGRVSLRLLLATADGKDYAGTADYYWLLLVTASYCQMNTAGSGRN